ncbi:MAG: VIT1/CCC1 transporter family protein [Candidatus Omnitrophica bacterium]|nr:VIT1/CCC1 transporter family protein [Candidatus Omnitrophota bacterium]
MLDDKSKKIILEFQKDEITEYFVYRALARLAKTENNRMTLKKIAEEEMRHYCIWYSYSKEKVKPDNLKRWFYIAIATVFGVTFGIKLMEIRENRAQDSYVKLSSLLSEADQIRKEEFEHETQLIKMIDEDKLQYMGSMVLGLNDALVEFTGSLAGFTFALQNSRLISMAGIIMGLSASFSMAASEYLSTKTEAGSRDPFRASFYTGIAYIFTVIVLVFPYFLFKHPYFSLAVTLGLAVLLILIFTFYSSVIKELSFRARLIEMFTISMGVASLSFVIGFIVKKILNIDI